MNTGIYCLYAPLRPGHCGRVTVQQSHKCLGLVTDEGMSLQGSGGLGDVHVEVIGARAYGHPIEFFAGHDGLRIPPV